MGKRIKLNFESLNEGKYEVMPKEKIYETNKRIKKEMKNFIRKMSIGIVFLLMTLPLYSQECIISPANNFKGDITVCDECTSCPDINGLEIETSTNIDTIFFNQNLTVTGLLEVIPSNSNVFFIPEGDTIIINGDFLFTGNASPKDFVIDGVLVVNGRMDFGEQQIEIDGNGSITADILSGATKSTCEDDTNCPTFEVDDCQGTGLCDEEALPIELVEFRYMNDKLIWKTISEVNFSHFELERKDSSGWKMINRIDSKNEQDNFTLTEYEYEFTEHGRYYFRLKQVDIDGSYEYSKVITVLNRNNNLNVYPNPIKNELKLNIEDSVLIRIFDLRGTEVLEKRSGNNIQLNLENGNYILVVNHKGIEYRKNIIVNNN